MSHVTLLNFCIFLQGWSVESLHFYSNETDITKNSFGGPSFRIPPTVILQVTQEKSHFDQKQNYQTDM